MERANNATRPRDSEAMKMELLLRKGKAARLSHSIMLWGSVRALWAIVFIFYSLMEKQKPMEIMRLALLVIVVAIAGSQRSLVQRQQWKLSLSTVYFSRLSHMAEPLKPAFPCPKLQETMTYKPRAPVMEVLILTNKITFLIK